MRVLGVDPGLTRCGLAVVESGNGRAVKCLEVGVARSGPTADIGSRLVAIDDVLGQWLARWQVDVLAVEQVFSGQNVRTVMGTAQVTALAILRAARANIPVAFHTPTQVKAAVTGSGRADKAQVQKMVKAILQLTETPRPADAADALALCICHLWRGSSAPGAQLTTAQSTWIAAQKATKHKH